MQFNRRNATFFLVVCAISVMAYFVVRTLPGQAPATRSLGQLQQAAENWKQYGSNPPSSVSKADVINPDPKYPAKIQGDGASVLWYGEDGNQYSTTISNPIEVSTIFVADGFKNYQEEASSGGSTLLSILLQVVPTLLLLGFFLWVVLRYTQSGNNQALQFGRSRARLLAGDKPSITFADVAGVDEAKQELNEVVEFLKYPDKFTAVGARIPKGVLLVGPPGTGKTLLSKAVAGEAGVPFFSISGSEFVEMFVGVGASRVRDLFDQAKKNSPCIVFVDEIDAVGRQRGAGLGGGHDEREQTLNQLLVEMDGFETSTHVIVIAATNRPDVLDPALLRPGRFDRHVTLDRPDIRGRKAILNVHGKNKPLGDVDLEVIAKQTPGFSGADLSNLINEAAILCARGDRKTITMADMEEAIARVVAGPERKSRMISEGEKKTIAYHEMGHALVMKFLTHSDPVHKISIVSRGMALGWTMSLPVEDKYLVSKAELQDQLAGILGGRCAEELVFGEKFVTSGASDDIRKVTQLARKMVTEWGMSERLGPLAFGHKEELVFLGRDLGEQRNYSEEIASEIDSEVHRLVETAFTRSREVLKDHEPSLHACSKRLIEIETMDAPEMDRIIDLTEGEGASKTKAGSNGSTPVIAATGNAESKAGSTEESSPAAG